MINLTPNWRDIEKFTTTNLNLKNLQLCQNHLLDFFASFSPFKIRHFFWTWNEQLPKKTLKHLHNIGQEYLECLHHMIASNQQNFPLLCCSGCANSTNFCLGILGFGYYIMPSKPKRQSSTNSQEKTHLQKQLTCQDPAPPYSVWKTIHTPQVLLVHGHKAAPFQSRGVPTAWRHEPGSEHWIHGKKGTCLNRCSYGLQHLKCEMWKHDVQGHTHLNGSKSKSFTSLQKEAI